VLRRLSRTLTEQGVEAAVAEHRRLRETEPDAWDFDYYQYYHVANGYRSVLQEPAPAVAVLRLAAALHPTADYHYVLAQAHAANGEPDRAAEAFERCLEVDPQHPHAARDLRRLRARDTGG
jgi:tetratricopeptide (TPR) repeat protein